jgi:NADP-dependent 3-hydroxy acid dehydrogenase YdfG
MSVLGVGRSAGTPTESVSVPSTLAWAAADLTTFGAMDRLLAETQARFGATVSVAVLSAGRGLRGSLLTSDPDTWRELLEINYLSLMGQMRAVAQDMVRNAAEHPVQDLVVIGSTVGRQVSAMNPIYGSTKFAAHSLVESLRQEICSHNIRVSLVEPGFVRSGFQRAASYDPAWFDALESESGPFLRPDDVAATIGFLVAQPPHVHLDDVRIRPTRQKV